MTTYIYGMILTQEGTFSNNRGEGAGVTANLQKVFRNGDQWTTVSAEAIRYALREGWQFADENLNRTMPTHAISKYEDIAFEKGKWQRYLDDDILGFMHVREKQDPRARRAPLEVTRAISITPWLGETISNFASTGSNPSDDYDKSGKPKSKLHPHPHAVEVHHTRYQFGFSLTCEAIGREDNIGKTKHGKEELSARIKKTLNGLISLRRVGGAHARYFADYSAAAVVLRVTDDPAPRFLYCFEQEEGSNQIALSERLVKMVGGKNPDIQAGELIIGTTIALNRLEELEKATTYDGNVKAVVDEAIKQALKSMNHSG